MTVAAVVAFIDWWLALQEVLAVAIALQQVRFQFGRSRIMEQPHRFISQWSFFVSLLAGRDWRPNRSNSGDSTYECQRLAEIDPTLPPQTGSFFHNRENDSVKSNQSLLKGADAANKTIIF